MQLDLEYLRQHYASLSDRGLLAINRSELVEAAREIFDLELAKRKLAAVRTAPAAVSNEEAEIDDDDDDVEFDDREMPHSEEKPDWEEDAVEVVSYADVPGAAGPAADAREALVTAGIPCYLDLCEAPREESSGPGASHVWRVMVPGKESLRAASVFDQLYHNQEFEAAWKTHLHTLSDDEVIAQTPEVVFPGLFDRIERLNRAYDEETARRGLK